eukprot:3645561-Alexandrium_andersonii.AAC.1
MGPNFYSWNSWTSRWEFLHFTRKNKSIFEKAWGSTQATATSHPGSSTGASMVCASRLCKSESVGD